MASKKYWLSLSVVIFFISTLSFALGYLANREFNHAPIIIENCSNKNQ